MIFSKKYYLLLVIIFFNSRSLAQTRIITYEVPGFDRDAKKAIPFTFNRDSVYHYPPRLVVKLLCNDSIGFSLLTNKNKKVIEMFERVGKRRIPFHYSFGLLHNNVIYNVSSWPQEKKNLFILDTLRYNNWQYDSDEIYTAFNYSCNLAYYVSPDGDTTFAYYSKELVAPFGPLYTKGLPGLILGTFEQRGGRAFVVTNIETIDYEMKLPQDKIILTRKEYETSKK